VLYFFSILQNITVRLAQQGSKIDEHISMI